MIIELHKLCYYSCQNITVVSVTLAHSSVFHWDCCCILNSDWDQRQAKK